MRVGFFGPFGTFTEQALRTQPDLAAGEPVAFPSVPDVLDAVAAGDVELGVSRVRQPRLGAAVTTPVTAPVTGGVAS